jgi:hypothetical protein
MWERTGDSPASYPFQIQPLPRDFGTGIYSPSMMNSTIALCARLKPRQSSGGVFELDSFQLRAAAFSARVTLKLPRFLATTKKARESSPEKRRAEGIDPESIARLRLRIKHIVKDLERQMKRARRQFLKHGTSGEFRALSKEWRSHLLWMQYRLAYFKPFRPVGPGTRRRQRIRIDLLVAMARKAIETKKLPIPNEKLLRNVIRRFIQDCHRGRIGKRDFLYMLDHQQSPIAQTELLKYVSPRLGLEK